MYNEEAYLVQNRVWPFLMNLSIMYMGIFSGKGNNETKLQTDFFYRAGIPLYFRVLADV